ncbi:hypothetical protein BJY04DRAFT_224088 [Aspergillus karnatakaensis]|uniref:uncharacterized protein n=1 Tax=Aspergillus karnatakaensis TaxID=1810916 RepID=UPI003CCE427B
MRSHDDFMHDVPTPTTATGPNLNRAHSPAETADELSRRKKTRTVHPSRCICRDWMIVSGNVHYARDKASFTTYTPLNVLLKNNIFNPFDEMQVAGVGRVELLVPAAADDATTLNTLVLEDVLHIPEAVCNGFNPLLVGSSMSCGLGCWEGRDRGGRAMWFGLPFAGMGRLVLATGMGEGEGESELIEGRQYTLSLYVSPEEKGVIMAGGR